MKSVLQVVVATVVLGVAGGGATRASAQDSPLSHVAEPGVYKVISENAHFRVVQAVWKPGQRDAPHSHPATAVYYQTSCTMQAFGPDGSPRGGGPIGEGTVFVQDPIAAHAVQNTGSKECRVLIFERK